MEYLGLWIGVGIWFGCWALGNAYVRAKGTPLDLWEQDERRREMLMANLLKLTYTHHHWELQTAIYHAE